MAEGTTARAAAQPPDNGIALVDAELLRSLRGAERPALPDGSQAAPVLVAQPGARIADDLPVAGVADGAPDPAGGEDATTLHDLAKADTTALATDAALLADPPTPAGGPRASDPPAAASFAQAPPPNASSSPVVPVPAPAAAPAPPPAFAEAAGEATPAPAAQADPPSTASSSGAAEASLPVADPARLSTRDATTREDTPITLDIVASLSDLDGLGDETLAILVGALPPGATLSAGVLQPDGSWLLGPGDLAGLQLIPGRDWSGEATLSIRAIVTGPLGDRAETTATLRLVVEAVADAPIASATGSGAEDTPIPLVLDVRTTDIDGSESISAIRIAGVPAGASLSAGTRGADGVWSLDPADLAGLTLSPPPHFAGEIALVLTAQSREPNGSTATTTTPFVVQVGAVADAPLASAADSIGAEDSWIPLGGLTASLIDTDGSEALTVTIGGLPDGALLSAGTRQPDGSWLVPAADLASLAARAPENFSGTIALTLTARAHETGAGVADAETLVPFLLTVTPVVDRATITAAASGIEDSWIAIRTSFATPDADGSEQWAATSLIAGVPAGAVLSEGIEVAPGTWQVDTARLQAGAIAVRPPADSDADFDLTITTTLIDTGAGHQASEVFTGVASVAVAAVADAPHVTATETTGSEDSWIPIANLSAALADTDGSETLAVSILGMPDGASLSAGTRQPDGSWQVAATDLSGLAIRPPRDFAGDIALILRAAASEGDPAAAVPNAVAEMPFTVTVVPVVDGATITGSGSGAEDSWITLAGSLGASPDPSERWADTLTIAGLPAGAVLNAGTDLGGGAWQVLREDFLGGRIAVRPPADSDADFVLTLTGQVIDEQGGMTAARSISTSVPVVVTAVADTPNLAASDVTGREDAAIPLNIAAALADIDGSETLSVSIGGVPAGASLSAGSRQADGSWVVPTAALPTLALTPPANFSGSIPLSVTAVSTEARDSNSAVVSLPFTVTVNPVADAGTIAGSGTGNEDSWIRISASFATPDTDGSESWGPTTTISGVPAGAVLSQGRQTAPGVWEVTTTDLAAGRIAIRPPADSDVDMRLSLSTTLIDRSGGTTQTVSILPELRERIAANGGAGDAEVLFGTASGSGSNWNTTSMGGIDVDGDGVLDGSVLRITNFTGTALTFDVTSYGVGRMASDVWVAPNTSLYLYLPDAAPATMVTTLVGGGSAKLSDTKAMGPHSFGWSEPRTTGGITDTRTVTGSADIAVIAAADMPTAFAADATGAEDTWILLPGLGGALRDTDGSETLSFRISGLPAGARMSAGTANADGSWTLTPVQLAGVSVRPPANFSGAMDLTLTAIATEARDGQPTATSSATFRVGVDPVADAGTITGSAAGNEDSWITLSPRFFTPDRDGSEQWGTLATISSVPAGAVLSQGTQTAPGVWQVSTAELAAGRVKIRPPADSDADFSLRISTTLTDTGNGRSDTRAITGDLPVTVTAVADAPAISVAGARGNEDSWIPLNLSAALTDRDGSETLTVTLDGLPDGALLSAGTSLGNGLWRVDAAALPGLAVLPPRDFSGSLQLTLRATATDNDSSVATSTGQFTVTVDAVADVPLVRVAPAIGDEDTAIALNVSGRAVDLDGSETLAFFRISDVPAGAVLATSAGRLSAGADGSFLVPAAQAASLTITPPRDSDVDFTLRVSGIAREPNGSTAESPPLSLPVRVLGVADAPVGLAGGGSGSEDTPVPLNITARLADTDGSERLYYVVSGVPAGMSLNTGTYAGPGRWSLTAEQAAGAALITPPDWSGRVTLTLTAVAQEQDGGSSATSTIPITLDVTPVVDTPLVVGLSGTRWPTARGPEDSWIALDLDPGLRDSDGSERVVGSIVLSGLPAGATLGYRDGTVLSPSGGSYTVPVARMGDVVVRPPSNSDVAFDVAVRMTVSDSGSVQQTFTGALRIDPEGRADAPVFTVADARGIGHRSDRAADGFIALPIGLAVSDTDGSETARLILRDVPDGFVLSAGRNMGGGVWVLEPGQQQGLSIRPPAEFAGMAILRAEALVTEREGDIGRTTRSIAVHVGPPAAGSGGHHGHDHHGHDHHGHGEHGHGHHGHDHHDGHGHGHHHDHGSHHPSAPRAPDLVVALSDGREDQPLDLVISAGRPSGGVGSVTVTYVVDQLPPGARLSAGFHDPVTDRWLLSAAELGGLQLIPPANLAGPIALSVSAIATDAIGQVARTTRSDGAILEAVADAPLLGASPAQGIEDVAVALNLSATPADRDGSERITSVVISNLPAGARLVGAGITDDGNGRFSVDPAQLGTVRVMPPPNAHGSFTLTLSATATEASNGSSRTESRSVSFTVAADPDAPGVVATDAHGIEDSPIALQLGAALADTDGSEAMSLVIGGLPAGAILSAGINNGNGSWTLLPSQLGGLSMTPPRDFSGTISATLTAYAMERSTGAVASTVRPFAITVAPVADTPIIVAPDRVSGMEDAALPVGVQARLADTDGSEVLKVVATDVPAGGRFTAGLRNADGSWTFSAAELPGLAFIPPENFSGQLTLRFTSVATEPDGSSASMGQSVTFVIAAVADAPLLSAPAVTGIEDAPTALPISVALADADGSESLQAVVIAGVPAGFRLSAGTDHGNGSYSVPVDQLPGLALLAPANWNGTLSLSVTASAHEATGGAASATIPLSITIDAVNDAPVLLVTQAAGTTAGAAAASLVGSVTATDIDGDPVAGAIVSLGAGHQPDDAIMVQGYALHAVGGRTMIGDTGIELVGGGFDSASGRLELAGAAPQATYQAVLAALVLVNANGGALEAGDRSITIALRDPSGATDSETVTVAVAPSVLHGNGTDAILAGTGASDTFHGSSGNETMLGGAGHDLFLLAIHGGHDSIDGGAGHDTIALSGVAGPPTEGPPAANGWQLVLDGQPAAPVQGANSLDFSEPVTGQIVMGDGTQVDFTGIERITW